MQDQTTLIVGSKFAGKTVLFNLLNDVPLEIGWNYTNWEFVIRPRNYVTPDPSDLESIKSNISPKYCDQPGFSRMESRLSTFYESLFTYRDLKSFARIRILIVLSYHEVFNSDKFVTLKYLNRLAKIYNFTESCFGSVQIVFSKFKLEDNRNPVEYLFEQHGNQSNVLIKGLKEGKIVWEYWHEPNSELNFNESEIVKIKQNTEKLEFLNNFDLNLGQIEEKLYQMALDSRNNRSENSEKNDLVSEKISFIDELSENFKKFENFLLIIDKNITLTVNSDLLVINPHMILVKTNRLESNSRTLTIKASRNFELRFGDSLNFFANSEEFLIKIEDKNEKSRFFHPNPQDQVKTSVKIVRVESIPVNSLFTEYASYNNKFLELIVYWDHQFGKVSSAKKWNYSVNTVQIYGKFYVNECMRTKNNIREKFLSAKHCKDEKEYFEKLNIDTDYEILEAFKNYIYRIPSIFEIIVNPTYYGSFIQGIDAKDIAAIREILIARYLRIIKKFNKNKIPELQHFSKKFFDENYQNMNDTQRDILITNIIKYSESKIKFDNFLRKIENIYRVNLTINFKIKQYKKIILDFLLGLSHSPDQMFQLEVIDFFDFFYTLQSDEIGKKILFDNYLSGDISKYSLRMESLSGWRHAPVNFVLLPCAHATLGVVAGVIVRKGLTTFITIAKTGTAALVKNGWKVGLASTVILGVVEVGLNAIIASAKSKYLDHHIIDFNTNSMIFIIEDLNSSY